MSRMLRRLQSRLARCRFAFALAWVSLLLGGASHAAPVQMTDARNVTHTWPAPPQRLISLLPSITESVCALGACARLVGVDRYSNFPTSVLQLPQLGGLDDAQVERIVALRPDVVLAARSARVIDRLEALGLKVVVVQAETHAEVRTALALLAQLLGESARAEALWRGIQADLARAAQRVPRRERRHRRAQDRVAAEAHGVRRVDRERRGARARKRVARAVPRPHLRRAPQRGIDRRVRG